MRPQIEVPASQAIIVGVRFLGFVWFVVETLLVSHIAEINLQHSIQSTLQNPAAQKAIWATSKCIPGASFDHL